MHLILKAVSVLTSYKPVFAPNVTNYQLQGFSGRQLSWTQPWQKSEPLTWEPGFFPQNSSDYSKLYVLTEFWFCRYLFIYMLILARYFSGGWKQILKCSCISGMFMSVFSTQLTAEKTNLMYTYQRSISHIPLIQFPERWVLNSTNPFNNCFGHCALKVHFDFLVFFRRTVKLNQL